MKKQNVIRIYHFTDAELVSAAKEVIAYIRRDAAAFTPFGVTATGVTAFETAVNAFSNTVTDVEMLGDQTSATALKDAKAEQLRVAIRAIMVRAASKYGKDAQKYRKFGAGSISQLSDSELVICAKRVVRVGTLLLSELAGNGLTAAMLTAITTLCNELDTLIVDAQLKVADRDLVQEDRVEAGNALYVTLSSFVSTGKNIWETSDAAKYNDYILYNTSPAAGDSPGRSESA